MGLAGVQCKAHYLGPSQLISADHGLSSRAGVGACTFKTVVLRFSLGHGSHILRHWNQSPYVMMCSLVLD